MIMTLLQFHFHRSGSAAPVFCFFFHQAGKLEAFITSCRCQASFMLLAERWQGQMSEEKVAGCHIGPEAETNQRVAVLRHARPLNRRLGCSPVCCPSARPRAEHWQGVMWTDGLPDTSCLLQRRSDSSMKFYRRLWNRNPSSKRLRLPAD